MDNTVAFFGTPVSYHLLEGIEEDKQILFEYAKDLTNFRFIEGGRNWMSLDDNLLVTLGCKTLQQAIQEKIEWYADEVMGIEYDEIYATQCWLNQYPPGSSHHMHSHPNCLISSNLWLKTSENCGNLVFEDPYINFRQIEPNIKKETPYNNKTMSIEPVDNHLVIFPSSVHHTVQQNMSSQTRMSLAVNYWIRGTLGVDQYYNKLVL